MSTRSSPSMQAEANDRPDGSEADGGSFANDGSKLEGESEPEGGSKLRELTDEDYKTFVVDMNIQHRKVRQAVKNARESYKAGSEPPATDETAGRSAEDSASNFGELCTRIHESFAFPQDKTQDVARTCPAILVEWLKSGLEDVKALGDCSEEQGYAALRKTLLDYTTEARTAIEHLKREYDLDTSSAAFWKQKADIKIEESAMMMDTIRTKWREVHRDMQSVADYPDLIQHVWTNRGSLKYPGLWKGDEQKKSDFMNMIDRIRLSQEAGTEPVDYSSLDEKMWSLKRIAQSPLDDLRDVIRNGIADEESIRTVLGVPSTRSSLIKDRVTRILQNQVEVENCRDRASQLRLQAASTVSSA